MKVIKVEKTKQDYYLVFSIFVTILTIIAIFLTIAIPIVLRKRILPRKLVCRNISADNNSEIIIYNEDAPYFGKYYLDPDTLNLTLFRPSKSFLYRDNYLYNSDRTKVLTLRRISDFFFVNVFILSFEDINQTDNEIKQKWNLSGGIISTTDLKHKLKISETLKLQAIFYGAINETSCNWVFERV
jgi:hypothetical protein